MFIYDDEAFLQSKCRKKLEKEKGQRGERWYGQYLQGVALEEEIRNSQYFTIDPSKATLFFVPLRPAVLLTLCSKAKAKKNEHKLLMNRASDVLSLSPWYQRFHGADHFIADGHWNVAKAWSGLRQLHNITLVWSEDRHPKLSPLTCTVEAPYEDFSLNLSFRSKKNGENREHMLMFSGKVDTNNLICANARKSLVTLNKLDGFVGSNTFRSWEKGSRNEYHKIARQEQLELMRQSEFCAIPCGDSPMYSSARLLDAITTECIPVIISDRFIGSFSSIVDWNSFSLRVSEHEFSTDHARELLNMLKRIPTAEVNRMRLSLQMYKKDLLYHTQDSRVVSHVLDAVNDCKKRRVHY